MENQTMIRMPEIFVPAGSPVYPPNGSYGIAKQLLAGWVPQIKVFRNITLEQFEMIYNEFDIPQIGKNKRKIKASEREKHNDGTYDVVIFFDEFFPNQDIRVP